MSEIKDKNGNEVNKKVTLDKENYSPCVNSVVNSDSTSMFSNLASAGETDLFDIIAHHVTSGQYKDGWDEDKWEQQMEEHPLFMKKTPEGDLPPLVEAISQIKYDKEAKDQMKLAINHKDDGNENFRLKKYRWAIDCYTKAIDCKINYNQLNSVFYNNRASAQFHVENFLSSMIDALQAVELNPDNKKAAIRAVECMLKLGKYQHVIDFCQSSKFKSDLTFYETIALDQLKCTERDNIKRDAQERRWKAQQEDSITKAVQDQKIRTFGSLFNSVQPSADGNDDLFDGRDCRWPVLFVYPGTKQGDFIENFNENDTFAENLEFMLPMDENHPNWHTERKYLGNINISFQQPRSKLLDCNWIQLSGHENAFAFGSSGILFKKCKPDSNEAIAYKSLMKEMTMKPFVPEFHRTVTLNGSCFIAIDNLLYHFDNPFIMDIKMGSRTFLEDEVSQDEPRKDLYEKMIKLDPSALSKEEKSNKAITKLKYMQLREQLSSSSNLGFRIEAFKTDCKQTKAKDLSFVKSRSHVKNVLQQFLPTRRDQLYGLLERIQSIYDSFRRSKFFATHEVIGSSLLLVYDQSKVGVWMIDFAKTVPLPEGVTIDHYSPWVLGNHEDGYLFGLENLINILKEF